MRNHNNATYHPAAAGINLSFRAVSVAAESKRARFSSDHVLMCCSRLKCDRQQPCRACVDRGLSLSCTFSRHPQPSAPETKPSQDVHNRIDQLEKLVTTLMNEKRNGNQGSPGPMAAYSPKVNVGDSAIDAPDTPDRVKLESNETSYTNSDHWTSILDGVSGEHTYKAQLTQAIYWRAPRPSPLLRLDIASVIER